MSPISSSFLVKCFDYEEWVAVEAESRSPTVSAPWTALS